MDVQTGEAKEKNEVVQINMSNEFHHIEALSYSLYFIRHWCTLFLCELSFFKDFESQNYTYIWSLGLKSSNFNYSASGRLLSPVSMPQSVLVS